MILQKANKHFSGRKQCFNPLWQIIGMEFMDAVNANCWDEFWDPEIYVVEREPGGLAEADVEDHLRSRTRRVFVVQANAGVGKTTFLRHALMPHWEGSKYDIFWLDISKAEQHIEADDLYRHTKRRLAQLLEAAVTRFRTSPEEWWRFILERWSDERGLSSVILHELGRGSLSDAGRRELMELLKDIDFLERARLAFVYLRKAGRVPVIVLDNCDLRPARFQKELFLLAGDLAQGSERAFSPETGSIVRLGDDAIVFISLRPETWSEARPEKSATTSRGGTLNPPHIEIVLRRRLARFFEGWGNRKIIRNLDVPTAKGELLDLNEQFGGEDIDRDEVAKTAVMHVTNVLTAGAMTDSLAGRIQRMTNGNTRLTLVAVSNYCASGHIDWAGLIKKGITDETRRQLLSNRKTLKAALLGPRSVFIDTDKNWVLNVFDSGSPDSGGALSCWRVLTIFGAADRKKGLVKDEVAGWLESLFAWPVETTQEQIGMLERRGILGVGEDSGYLVATQAGDAYLLLIENFEYLQHVAVDVRVPLEYLVRCEASDEPASVRFERVLKLCLWLQKLERGEYQVSLARGQEQLYRRWFGETTLAHLVATTLRDVLQTLPKVERWRGAESLADEVRKVCEETTVESYRRMTEGPPSGTEVKDAGRPVTQ